MVRPLDIAFLVDATASMGPCIEGLKVGIDAIFKRLGTENNERRAIKDLRARIVGYRDVEFDGDRWYVDNPFVRTVEELQTQLNALEAKGGGDEPESLLDALLVLMDAGETGRGEKLCPSKWRPFEDAKRVIAVFTDATYHKVVKLESYRGLDSMDVAKRISDAKIALEIITPAKPARKDLTQEYFEECYQNLVMADKCELVPMYSRDGTPLTFKDTNCFTEILVEYINDLLIPRS